MIVLINTSMDDLKSIEITYDKLGIERIINFQGFIHLNGKSTDYWNLSIFTPKNSKDVLLNSKYKLLDIIEGNFIFEPILTSYDVIFDDIDILEENK